MRRAHCARYVNTLSTATGVFRRHGPNQSPQTRPGSTFCPHNPHFSFTHYGHRPSRTQDNAYNLRRSNVTVDYPSTLQLSRLHFVQLVGEFDNIILHPSQLKTGPRHRPSTYPFAGNPHCWVSFAGVACDRVTLTKTRHPYHSNLYVG